MGCDAAVPGNPSTKDAGLMRCQPLELMLDVEATQTNSSTVGRLPVFTHFRYSATSVEIEAVP